MSPAISLLAACARIHARGVIDPRPIDGEVTCLVSRSSSSRRGSCNRSHAILTSPTLPGSWGQNQGLTRWVFQVARWTSGPSGQPTGAPQGTCSHPRCHPVPCTCSPWKAHGPQHFAPLCFDSPSVICWFQTCWYFLSLSVCSWIHNLLFSILFVLSPIFCVYIGAGKFLLFFDYITNYHKLKVSLKCFGLQNWRGLIETDDRNGEQRRKVNWLANSKFEAKIHEHPRKWIYSHSFLGGKSIFKYIQIQFEHFLFHVVLFWFYLILSYF